MSFWMNVLTKHYRALCNHCAVCSTTQFLHLVTVGPALHIRREIDALNKDALLRLSRFFEQWHEFVAEVMPHFDEFSVDIRHAAVLFYVFGNIA